MGKTGSDHGGADEIRVLDDFSADYPIDPAELDAIEAFLAPLLATLIGDKEHQGS
jgi:hypothetical protein